MLGTELRGLDDWTLSLITNEEIIRVLKHSHGAKQIMRTVDTVVWKSEDEDGSIYVAFFNTSFSKTYPSVSYRQLGLNGEYEVRDLWAHKDLGTITGRLGTELNPHGAVLLKLI